MAPTSKFIEINDLNVSYYEWGNPQDPTILLVHATGMHGRVWDRTVEALPKGFHVIAVDQRGHGRSQSEEYLLDWSVLGKDASDFLIALNLKNVVGVGHSMGGHALLQAAINHPDRFSRLLLIDPVIFPPEKYAEVSGKENTHPTESPIARRRNQFENWQEMKSVFSEKTPYCHWMPDILENYCRFGLMPKQDTEGYCLACRPDVEASIYIGHCSVNLLNEIPNITVPTTIMRAKDRDPAIKDKIDFSASPTWEDLASLFPNGKDVPLKHLTHFIPMQDPALVAKYIIDEDS